MAGLDNEYLERRQQVTDQEKENFLKGKIRETEAAERPPEELPADERSTLSQVLRDTAGGLLQVGAGAVKGATLGGVDLMEGKVKQMAGPGPTRGFKVPGIEEPAKETPAKVPGGAATGGVGVPPEEPGLTFTPTLKDAMTALDVSPEVANSPYANMAGEMVGIVAPWSASARGVRVVTDALLKSKALLPKHASALKYAEDYFRGLEKVRRVGEMTAAGSLVSGARAMVEGQPIAPEASRGAMWAGGIQGGIEIAATAVRMADKAAGKKFGLSILARSLDDLTVWYQKRGQTKDDAWRSAASDLSAEITKAGGMDKLTASWAIGKRGAVKQATGREAKPAAAAEQPRDVTGGLEVAPLNQAQRETIFAVAAPRPLPYGWRTPREIERSVTAESWAILTAESPLQPGSIDIPEGQDRNQALIQWLLSKGYTKDDIFPVDGVYKGNTEKSLLIRGITPEETVEVLKNFGQESAATRDGLLYHDGNLNPIMEGLTFGDLARTQDGYSILKSSEGDIPFSLNLDFSQTVRHPNFSEPSVGTSRQVPTGVRVDDKGKTFTPGPDLDNPVTAHEFLSKKMIDAEMGVNDVRVLTSPEGGRAGVLLPDGNMIFRATHGEAMQAVPENLKAQVDKVKHLVLDVQTPAGRALLTVEQLEDIREAAKIGELKKEIHAAAEPQPRLAEYTIGKLEQQADQASQRLEKRFKGKFFDVVGALAEGAGTAKDLAIIGAANILRGHKTQQAWKNEMRKHFPDLTDKEIKKIRERAETFVEKLYASKGGAEVGKRIPELLELIEQGFVSPDWYKHAWDLSVKMFPEGEKDAAIFWAINAGMSPQTRVDINMDASLAVFRHWKIHGTEGMAEKAASAVRMSATLHGSGVGLTESHVKNMINVVTRLEGNPTRENLRSIIESGTYGEYSTKVPDYAHAILGREDVPVIDSHIIKAFGFQRSQDIANDKFNPRRELMKSWIAMDAKEQGITPVAMQANYWVANKVWNAAQASLEGATIDVEKVKGTIAPLHEVLVQYAKQQKDIFKARGINLNFDDLGLNEEGFARLGFTMLMARALIGAGIGGLEGETIEDRIENALIGAGVAMAAPSAIKLAGRTIAQVMKAGKVGQVANELQRSGYGDELMKLFDPPSLRKPGVPSPVATTGTATAAPIAAGAPADASATASTRGPASAGSAVAGAPTIPAPEAGAPPPKPLFEFPQLSQEQVAAFKQANPDTIDIGGNMMKVNWDEISDQSHIEQILKRLTVMNSSSIDVARRGKISVQKTQEMARKMGLSYHDIISRRRGEALNAEEAQAYIDFLGSNLKQTIRLMEELELNPGAGDLEDQFVKQLNITKAIHEQVMGARAEAGRALNIWGTDAQGYVKLANQLVTNLNTVMPGQATLAGSTMKITPTRLAAALKNTLGTDLKKISSFVDKATRPGASDMFFEAMYGLFFLSNPKTLAVNTLGNAMTTAFSVPERMLAAGVGGVSKALEAAGAIGPQVDHVAGSEIAAMVFGMANATDKAFQLAAHAFESGERSFANSKLEMAPEAAITGENMGLTGPMGHMIDFLGSAIRLPLRGLLATDEFFKVINGMGQVFSNGFRAASAQGLEGDAFAKSVIDRFKELPPEDLKQAQEYAEYQTFTQALGQPGQHAVMAINSLPLKYKIPLKLNLPFFTVPVNIFKYAAERTPLAFLHQHFLNDLKAGGAKRDLALGRLMLGTGLLLTAGYYALQGKITGHQASKQGEAFVEQSGKKQEYSAVTEEGNQYSFERLDPYGMILGFGADWANIMFGKEDVDLTSRVFLGPAMAVAWNLTSKTYLEGAIRMMKAMASGRPSDIEAWFKRQASVVVPAAARELTRTGLINEKYIRDARNAWDHIIAQTPGFSDSIPPHTDIFGYPVVIPGGLGPDVISPIAVSKRRNEPHYKALIESGISLTPPSNFIEGHESGGLTLDEPDPRDGIELSPKQALRYRELAGHGVKISGKTFEQATKDMVQSPMWTEGTDYRRQLIMSSLHNQYKKLARGQLLTEYDDLREKVRGNILRRAQAVRGAR